jgi:heme/copper-type cytochrome/quinol oxidase subunit 2
MRIVVLWVALAGGAGVFVAMIAATRRHRAHAPTFVQANATEYIWLMIPWLIVALSMAPAVRKVLAVE